MYMSMVISITLRIASGLLSLQPRYSKTTGFKERTLVNTHRIIYCL